MKKELILYLLDIKVIASNCKVITEQVHSLQYKIVYNSWFIIMLYDEIQIIHVYLF